MSARGGGGGGVPRAPRGARPSPGPPNPRGGRGRGMGAGNGLASSTFAARGNGGFVNTRGSGNRGTAAPRRPNTRERGMSSGRGRGAPAQTRQGSPDAGPPPSPGTMVAARDPTKTANRTQYMKTMTDLFQKFKENRERERKQAIRDGVLADPEKKTTLAEAITPVGTCQDMCPEFERVERIVQHAVDKCERKTLDDGSKVSWEPFMMKRFRRSAAGTDDQIPSDIRPPLILKKTLDYLLNSVVGGAEPLAAVHKFVWDRTRAIRNDFSIQQLTKVEDVKVAIECFERIARFHLLSLHELSHPTRDNGDFDAHQEREQLGNTLLSLVYYYDDSRKKFHSPNEAEFRAYGIIFEIQDRRPDVEYRVQTWPKSLLQDRRVQTALRLHAAASNIDDDQGPLNPRVPFSVAQDNFGRFWSIVHSSQVSYLAACAAEIYFNFVRHSALTTMYKSYRRPSPLVDDLTLGVLLMLLGFDTEEQAQKFCEDHGFTVKEKESGEAYVDLASVSTRWLNDSNSGRGQTFSQHLVEVKRHGRTLPAVIKGYSVARCKAEGLIEASSDEDENMLFLADDDQAMSMDDNAAASTALTPANPFGKATKATSQAPPQQPANPFASTAAKQTTFDGSSPFQTGQTSASTFPPPATTTVSNPFATATASPFNRPPPSNPTKPFAAATSSSFAPADFSAPSNPFTSSTSLTGEGQAPASPFTSWKSDASSSINAPKLDTGSPGLQGPTGTAAKSNPFGFLSQQPSLEPKKPSFGEQPTNTSELSRANKHDEQKTSDSAGNKTPQLSTDQGPQPPPGPKKSLFQFPPSLASPTEPAQQPLAQLAGGGEKHQTPKSVRFDDNVHRGPAAPVPSPPSLSIKAAPPGPEKAGLFLGAHTQAKTPSPLRTSFFPQPQGQSGEAPALHSHSGLRPSEFIQQKHEEEKLRRQQEEDELEKHRKETRGQGLDRLAYHYTTCEGGVLDMYLERLLQPIASKYVRKVAKEKDKARAAEARAILLSMKYFRRWQTITYNRNLVRNAKARRQRMQEARQNARASVRSSRATSVTSSEFDPLGSLIHPHATSAPQITRESPDPQNSASKRRSLPNTFDGSERAASVESGASSNTGARQLKKLKISHHSRSRTMDGSLQRSSAEHKKETSLSRSTNRLLYNQALPNEALLKKARRLVTGRTDTTQTDYFRLKAMGVSPDTPVIPETRKRPRISDGTEASARAKALRSSPPRPESIQRWSRSTSRVSQDADQNESPVRSKDLGDVDELLAKARAVRQNMADSQAWFKSTRERYESERRSTSAAQERRDAHIRSLESTPSRTSMRHATTGSNGFLERWEQIKERRATEAEEAASTAATPNVLEPEVIDFDNLVPNGTEETPTRPMRPPITNGADKGKQPMQAGPRLKPMPQQFGDTGAPFGGGAGTSAEDAIEL